MRGLAKAPSAASNSSAGLRGRTHGFAALLAILALGAVAASSAMAATGVGHAPLTPITGATTPAGSFGINPEGTMGIDEGAGKGYVADYYVAGVVDVFDLATGAYLDQITSADLVGAPFGTKLNPTGAIAVDNSGGATDGQVYVASADPNDASRGRIFVFDASGTYLRTIDGSETSAGSFGSAPTGLAVDDSTGRLFVSDSGNNVVDRFSAGGTYLSQIALDPADGTPAGLDLDSAGNLYLNRYYHRAVEKYGPAGNFLAVIDNDGPVSVAVDASDDHVYIGGKNHIAEYDSTGALVSRFANGESNLLSGLAVDSSTGRIYDNRYEAFNVYAPAATVTIPEVSIDPVDVGGVGYFEATVEGGIDPDGAPSWYAFEYRSAGGGDWSMTSFQAGGEGSEPVPVSATITGLQAGTEYVVRLVGLSDGREASAATATVSFKTKEATPPAITIDPVSAITADGAHLSGTVNPNDLSTSAHFEYSGDGSNWTSLPDQDVGAGTSPVAIEGDVEGLEPNQHYLVRLVANNQASSTVSDQITFTTLALAPNAYTSGAAPRTQTTARLHAFVNPRRTQTSYHFEFGVDAAYGASYPASEGGDAGSSNQQQSVSETVAGLQPETTYHYRIVAKSVAGIAVGDDISFTTRGPSEAGPRQRGIELINSPDKGNQTPNPSLVSPNADKILWSTLGGAPGATTGNGSVFMAQRSSDGWRSQNILPPRNELVGEGSYRYVPLAATPQFTRFLYGVTTGAVGNIPPTFATANADGSGQRVLGTVTDTNTTSYVQYNDDFSHVYGNMLTRADPTHPAGDLEEVYDFASGAPVLASAIQGSNAALCGVTNSSNYAEWARDPYPWNSTAAQGPARVFFESMPETACGAGVLRQVFMRDLDASQTTLLTGPALPGGPSDETGAFIRANADGSQSIVVATSRLTADDTNDGIDIYRYTVGKGPECLTCSGSGANLTRDDFARFPVVATPDLSRLYFTSPSVLVPGAGSSIEVGGTTNMYTWHAGKITYVGPSEPLVSEQVEVTPDGNALFFVSGGSDITNDDTGGLRMIYRYGALDRSLECITCKAGVTLADSYFNAGAGKGDGGFGFAAEHGNAYVFMTDDALEPRDVNNAADVYEWRNGQVALVTDGVTEPAGRFGIVLVGQGQDGMNVLFTSGNNLTGYERDNIGQYYAARVGGGFGSPPTSPVPCEGGDCQGPLWPPPSFQSPGSGSLRGVGDQRTPGAQRKACKKDRKGKRRALKAKCAKAKKAKNAKNNRRGK